MRAFPVLPPVRSTAAIASLLTASATVGGMPISQLTSDGTISSSSGRMFVMDGLPLFASGSLESIKLKTGTATSCRLSIWRAGTRIWQSDTQVLVANSDNTIALTGVSVQVDDLIGIWIPTGSLTFHYKAFTGVTLRYATDATADLTSVGSLSSTLADTAIFVEAVAVKPFLAITGDSISEGHNSWHGPQHAITQGGTITWQPGYVAAKTKNWGYRNYGLGSQTFAWVASTGAPAAFASGATHVWIHCGVNDVAAARTWAAVETNLDTILAAKPEDTRLYISEILPWTGASDAEAATIRTWNGNLATWCTANSVTLLSCHDAMGQTRVSTGQLDDLKASYSQDGLHLSQAGVNRLAFAFAPFSPVFSTVPTISGVANIGSTLTATSGTVTGEPTSTWQWYADGVAISGATSITYALTASELSKTITVVQTATNSAGSASSTSIGVGPVANLPVTVDFDGSTGYVTGTPQNVFASASFSIGVEIDSDAVSGYIASMNSNNVLIAYSGSNIIFGNGTGWAEWTAADGVWRFIHDRTQTGFARLIAYKDGVLQTQAATSGTYADFTPPNTVMEFGRRTNATSYFNGRLSAIKVWSRVCLPADSDQSSNLTLNLQTITSGTWDDTSSNNTDYTLTGGATAV